MQNRTKKENGSHHNSSVTKFSVLLTLKNVGQKMLGFF